MYYNMKLTDDEIDQLNIPYRVKRNLKSSHISYDDYIKYNLNYIVPTNYIDDPEGHIVRFIGLGEAKKFDWDLFNSASSSDVFDFMIRYRIKENVNEQLYEEMKSWSLEKYTDGMIEYFSKKLEKDGIDVVGFKKVAEEYPDVLFLLWEDDELLKKFCNDNLNALQKNNIVSRLVNEYFNKNIAYFLSSDFELFNQVIKISLRHNVEFPIKEYCNKTFLDLNSENKKEFLLQIGSLSNKELMQIPYIFEIIDKKKLEQVTSLLNIGIKNILQLQKGCGVTFSNTDLYNLIRSIDKILKNKKFDEDLSSKEKIYKALRIMITNKEYPYIDRRLWRGEFRLQNKDLFLNFDVPDELKDAFYNKKRYGSDLVKVDLNFISKNLDFISYLSGKNLDAYFEFHDKRYSYDCIFMNSDMLLGEASYIRSVVGDNDFLSFIAQYSNLFDHDVDYRKRFSIGGNIEILEKELNQILFEEIFKGNSKMDNLPNSFKAKYPYIGINYYAPKELKKKYYNREFTPDIYEKYPEILEYFDDKVILLGFRENLEWIREVCVGYDKDMPFRLAIAYMNIDDEIIKQEFKSYFENNIGNYDLNTINLNEMSTVFSKLSYTNSSELDRLKAPLVSLLLESNDPLNTLDKIEDIFIRDNLPVVGKVFSVFQTLHPNMSGFASLDCLSPVLENSSTRGREAIIFADLLKINMGSNNRSIKRYIDSIIKGDNLFRKVCNNEFDYNKLNYEDKKILNIYCDHLGTLYNNTLIGRSRNNFVSSSDIIRDINTLKELFSTDGKIDYDLPDRIVRMFGYFAGIESITDIETYMKEKINLANYKNRLRAKKKLVIEEGDYVKGVRGIKNFSSILQNGCVAREFLGRDAGSDRTPLDTDLFKIFSCHNKVYDTINETDAFVYGDLVFVLKDDDRFTVTRRSPLDSNKNVDGLERKIGTEKIEAFFSGAVSYNHYAIRTGFASSEIDYIVVENYNERIGIEIAKNGFYIPVADKDGEIIFTPKDYDNIRSFMAGLSYYGATEFILSDDLINDDVKKYYDKIEENNGDIDHKRNKISIYMRNAFEQVGLDLKTNIDGDLSEGVADVIDIGSTDRGTNVLGDGDFDFVVRLDNSIMSNPGRLDKVKYSLLKAFDKELVEDDDNLILENVTIGDVTVNMNIKFTEKLDKINYSTDMAIKDRLSTIKDMYPDQYPYVVANIMLAKDVLKKAGAYSANVGDDTDGGLGGVGIETWILQNGGSFVQAAKSFLKVAEGKDFEEFRKSYSVWDFGENYDSVKQGIYPHDNFVIRSMSNDGYNKMKITLKNYLSNLEKTLDNDSKVIKKVN